MIERGIKGIIARLVAWQQGSNSEANVTYKSWGVAWLPCLSLSFQGHSPAATAECVWKTWDSADKGVTVSPAPVEIYYLLFIAWITYHPQTFKIALSNCLSP